jgi:CubicO group peptidase (beta-lactamase class C family)
VWSYNTGGAWLLGRALEKATGSPLARYLETRLWRRLPMEADGVWEALLPGQAEMGGHGFNATLRDWGRFGLFVARGGRLADGEPLLPDGWLEASTRWTQARGSVTADAPEGQFGYQWWLTPVPAARLGAQEANAVARRTFWAQGIFGQAMAIDREDGIVMVQWSVWPEAEKPDAIYDEQAMFFAGVVRARRGAVDVPHP